MEEENDLNLGQRVHLARKEIRYLQRTPLVVIGIGVIFLLFIIPAAWNTRNAIVSMATPENKDNIVNVNMVQIIGFVAILTAFFVSSIIILYRRARRLRLELNDWENDYLYQNYLLTFETNPPKGSTNGEKIFNLAQIVFLELRKKPMEHEPWTGTAKGENGYEFDCYQKTYERQPSIFIAKHFGDTNITFDMIKDLCKMAKKSRTLKAIQEQYKINTNTLILRVVCVGRRYDADFQKGEDDLFELMDKLDFEGPIDLILEEDTNYHMLYVDYE